MGSDTPPLFSTAAMDLKRAIEVLNSLDETLNEFAIGDIPMEVADEMQDKILEFLDSLDEETTQLGTGVYDG